MNPLPLAAVVVIFHPTQAMIARLESYARFLEHVVIVDNTEPLRLDTHPTGVRISYLPLGTNRGLGAALNAGIEQARGLGFDTVVLLDQDSVLTQEAVTTACAAMRPDIGIVSLNQVVHRDQVRSVDRVYQGCVDVSVTMTSGSVLNVKAFGVCGPFDDQLFIDYVDHDYCMRLRRHGYRIVQCMDAVLDHELGEPKRATLFGLSLSFISHRPFRAYYIFRNGLYVSFKYFSDDPKVALQVLKVLLKELVKAIALEPEKAARLRFVGLGIWHWLSNRYGRTVVP